MLEHSSGRVVALRRPATLEIAQAREIIRHQSGVIAQLAERIDESFTRVVDALHQTAGHVVVCGVGKSGQIGRKIASTLASTGTPAFFVNAGEAHHGDLGMITPRDTVMLISQSGQTEEVVALIPHLRRVGVPIIALVGELASALAREADHILDVSVDREVCPNNLAPTSSTLAVLAMGDALAVTVMQRRGFGSGDFARCHPGGTLGRRLFTRVKDVMRKGDLPMVSPTDTVGESLVTITGGRLGLVLVMQGKRLLGLITDGDLRRGMQRYRNLLARPVADIMTSKPVTIDEETLLVDAQQRMRAMKIKALVVLDGAGKVSGVVEVFDEK